MTVIEIGVAVLASSATSEYDSDCDIESSVTDLDLLSLDSSSEADFSHCDLLSLESLSQEGFAMFLPFAHLLGLTTAAFFCASAHT